MAFKIEDNHSVLLNYLMGFYEIKAKILAWGLAYFREWGHRQKEKVHKISQCAGSDTLVTH